MYVDVPVLGVPVLDVPVLDVPVLDVPVLDVPVLNAPPALEVLLVLVAMATGVLSVRRESRPDDGRADR